MAQQADIVAPPRAGLSRIRNWVLGIGAALLVALAALVVFLHTASGRQFVVDKLSGTTLSSGISVEIGSLEGSVFGDARLNQLALYDANDVLFLEVPQVHLDWRPLHWLFVGLDIRELVLSDGTLLAIPETLPGDPDAPLLPDFDIRIDRLALENLTIAEPVLGEERVIGFAAQANIHGGAVYIDADGEFGGGDVLAAQLHANPDEDRFDIDLDWQAPKGGLFATMLGAEEDMSARIDGEGSWSAWEGDIELTHAGSDLLDAALNNRAGQYTLVARLRPEGFVEGLMARAAGDVVLLNASGTFEDNVLDGTLSLRARALNADGAGAINLGESRFEDFSLSAQLLDSRLFSPSLALEGAEFEGELDGSFADLTVPHELRVQRIVSDAVQFNSLMQSGTLTFDGESVIVPLSASLSRVVSGNALADRRLVNGTVQGALRYANGQLTSDNLAINFPDLSARIDLASNIETGVTRVSGPVNLANFVLDDVGTIDSRAQLDVTVGSGGGWQLAADLDGQLRRISNSTIVTLAGETVRFAGPVLYGSGRPLGFDGLRIRSDNLSAQISGQMNDDGVVITGEGNQRDYGDFTFESTLADDGPRAVLVLASPLPAAGLSDVRVALEPSEDGFVIEANGGSMLGDFETLANLVMTPDGTTTLDLARLDVAQTRVAGTLQLVEGGVTGDLALSGGGVEGDIVLALRNGGQGFDVDLVAEDARFGGESALRINRGKINASGLIAGEGTSVNGTASLRGLSYGEIFIGRLAAQADVTNGAGHFDAAIAGRRGSQFELLVNGDASAERIAVALKGSYARREISMPRRAVLVAMENGGWRLQPSQISLGDGFVVASGEFGGTGPMQGRLALGELPLSIADVLTGDLGMGGTVSGVVDITGGPNGLPTAKARVSIDDLTRSSALLTSHPLDIALVAELSESQLQARAVIDDGNGSDGWVQARITNLGSSGALNERLYRGNLRGQARFTGDASGLWRLAAIDLLDVTGDLEVAADIRGTLANPQLAGSLAGDALRVRSALTGTDVENVRARGRFTGSRFNLTSFAGTAPNGGQVSGSGYVDLSNISASRGPSMDIRLATRGAEILDLSNMGATITGPLRIVSDGVGGTIAGRLTANRARWQLANAEAVRALPNIQTREINLPADRAPAAVNAAPWRYLIDVRAPGRIAVTGMGLDSEWQSDNLKIRGTTEDPRLDGSVEVVPRQGFYTFAGARFGLTRGEVSFDENVPIDPRIDLLAETEVDQLSVAVQVRGSASEPDITFTSVPALPEEELLARLLFGGSITNLSATDALQLAAAVASLRGGGGLDPINQLRSAIGLDRLRIVPADPALDRRTAVALGENFGRRVYVEIITDGAGYNATNLEFRITSWLNLLGSLSTMGRHSAAIEHRRDY